MGKSSPMVKGKRSVSPRQHMGRWELRVTFPAPILASWGPHGVIPLETWEPTAMCPHSPAWCPGLRYHRI